MNESRNATLTGLQAEPVPGERHIIFLENVCVLNDSVTGKQSGLAITQRQACAVASAANTNPDTKVYLLYTCSVIGNIGDSPEYVKQILSYPNVRIWNLSQTTLKELRWRPGILWGRCGLRNGYCLTPAMFSIS
jgi:hypothetical protein